ncbi:MAG TPA: polyphosphate kinase 1, partial [Acidiferrobacteraceae bacterium]|nr:polyphosphate kinase 1 [Acidiferrobacteraceae bacterium]
MDDINPTATYINRELSWIAFNRRVLERARDGAIPLLERLRFLCISSTNLDEFFEIRVGGLKQQVALGSVDAGPDNLAPAEILQHIHTATRALVAEQYALLNTDLLPALAHAGIRFIRREHWSARQSEWIRRYFHQEVLPVLSPQSLDPAHPFPRLLNKSLNFIVALEGLDAFGRDGGFAVVQAPRALPRVIPLGPRREAWEFVFLSSVIHAYVGELFAGMTVRACHQFRVTRNSDLFVDEEEIEDLLRALEGELPSRNYGAVVRLEVSDRCPADIAQFLLAQLGLGPEDLYAVEGPVNLNRLQSIYELVERPDLTFPAFTPALPRRLTKTADLFEVLRRTDVLLHHPFESFAPVVAFVHQAALDPAVLAIKQTLYRVGPESALVDALVVAARSGKEVTVVIELRARFDEEANIQLATRLHEAGAHVVYGVVGYKTHAKMVLVVRREGRRLRRYVHLATGNYHARTTRTYTDYGFFTADKQYGEDVHRLFLQLTGLSRIAPLKRLLQAPFTL